jgi:glycine betaine catabolism B
MSRPHSGSPRRLLHVALVAVGVGLGFGLPARGQVSPREHEQHHGGSAAGKAGGHEHGKSAPPKELFPSLMDLPGLSPERRAEVERQAHERMKEGAALMGRGLERLSRAAPGEDYAAMQEATAQVREGLARFESGLAAHRALAEGKAPREVALGWFKREMSLTQQPAPEGPRGPFGLSWFHFFVMAILIGFAAVMIWMYFHKMRRASELLARLTSGAPPAGTAPGATPAAPGATAIPPPAAVPPRTVLPRLARWPAQGRGRPPRSPPPPRRRPGRGPACSASPASSRRRRMSRRSALRPPTTGRSRSATCRVSS